LRLQGLAKTTTAGYGAAAANDLAQDQHRAPTVQAYFLLLVALSLNKARSGPSSAFMPECPSASANYELEKKPL
jgi:hypothetical protein